MKLKAFSEKPLPSFFLQWLPFLFFGFYMMATLEGPPVLSYDEAHYVPASKLLVAFDKNRNFEHPPLAKWIMGTSWLVFHELTGVMEELVSFRFMAVVFGLLALFAIYKWLQFLKFSPSLCLAGVWGVGFNFLWFVQSRTAMLDIFYVCFGLWGLYFIAATQRFKTGWVLLGCAMACKWSALPYLLMGLWFSRYSALKRICLGLAVCVGAYFIPFLPLYFFPQSEGLNLWMLQEIMLRGLESTSLRTHVYQSQWWQWSTLMRPMWYTSVQAPNHPGELLHHYFVFAGGNPLLFWLGDVALIFLGVKLLLNAKHMKHTAAGIVMSFFLTPFLMWIFVPRKLMFFYYILPSCLWYGPAVFLMFLLLFKKETAERLCWTFVFCEGLLFFLILPILDGRALPFVIYQKYYYPWMKLLNWI